MCMGGNETELEMFHRLITVVYPSGIVSIVSDTWDFWKVITQYALILKQAILERAPNALGMAKVVFRPDSGDPVGIICGTAYQTNMLGVPLPDEYSVFEYGGKYFTTHGVEVEEKPEFKGAVECLWDIFGGTTNEKGYKVLNERVGLIYGDSITHVRASRILERLRSKGFASSNIVFGIGSFTYQHSTRDSLGFAMKATYGEVNGEARELWKDPITDSGTKKSAKGLLRVEAENGTFVLYDQQTWAQEASGALETVFLDGKLVKEQSIAEIRRRVGFINM
jgi:nicotinamide phosphoribosyltransferase